MSIETTAIIVVLFSTCLGLHVLYWHVIRPVLLRGLLFRLFARRDALRWMAIEGEIDIQSYAYGKMETILCKTIAVVPHTSMTSMVWAAVTEGVDQEALEEWQRFEKEAPEKILKYRSKTMVDVFGLVMVNSPLWALGLAAFVLFLWVIGRFHKMLFIRQADAFVDRLPQSPGGSFQPA